MNLNGLTTRQLADAIYHGEEFQILVEIRGRDPDAENEYSKFGSPTKFDRFEWRDIEREKVFLAIEKVRVTQSTTNSDDPYQWPTEDTFRIRPKIEGTESIVDSILTTSLDVYQKFKASSGSHASAFANVIKLIDEGRAKVADLLYAERGTQD